MSEELLDVLRAGDVDRLAKLLASGADPNICFKAPYGRWPGLTPLQVAVSELQAPSELEPGGPIDAVVLLLRHGADVNAWDEDHGVTAIMMAVFMNSREASHMLLAAGADPNVCDEEGDSPLRWCAQEGDLEMARLLLHCGADKTIHEGGGLTDKATARKIHEHLGLPADPATARPRAREPAEVWADTPTAPP